MISIDAKEQGIPALFFCYSQGILEKETVGTSCPTQKVSCKEDIMSQTLEQFQAYQTRLEQYDQAIALLYWDLQTAAPKDSIEAKLSAVGYFSTESFRLSTADEYGSLLKKLSAPEEYDQLSPAMQLTIRRNLRDFERFQRIPEAFYTEYVTEKARSEKAWEAAKEASDFSVFAPHLDKVISMTKEYVHYMEPDQDVYEFLVGLFEDGMDTETIDRILEELKSLDPAGVCAFNLEECLKLQLERKKMLTPVMESLIDNHLDMVAKNQIPAIARALHLSSGEAAGYCQIIKSLNPKPGVSFSSRDQLRYIIPDVTIVKFKDHFDILLNESMYPGIEVNSYYRQMNQAPDSQELKEYLGNKIRQAEWVKQCITQRSKTMMDVSRVILERQEAFFSHGPNYLKPLRMTDIAEILGIHESTVSRAVSKKYLQCSWGVYPMNFFFSRNVGTSTSSTEKSDDPSKAVTARKIKQLLHEIIAEENKKKPYSDRLLGEKLTEKGISISRRTVAKYREEEGIPDASGRKEYT